LLVLCHYFSILLPAPEAYIFKGHMKLLCQKYSRYIIAALLLTVLYGKSAVCVASKALAKQSMSADTGELPTEDNSNETRKESTFKDCKKSWTEMEPGQELLPVHPWVQPNMSIVPLAACSVPTALVQKVPTPPPLA
jgi:hypothetical protein